MFYAGCELIGFGATAAATSATSTYIGNTSDTTDQTTYSFAGASIGTASSDRLVVCGFTARANAARTVSSVTIAGVSATLVGTAIDAGAGADLATMWIAAVPTGTTGTISITFSAAMLRCNVGVWTITGGGSATPTSTQTDNTVSSNVLSVSSDCPANGCIIAVSENGQGSGSATATWAGVTENYDTTVETTSFGASGASANFSSAQTGLTVSETGAATVANGAMVAAAWGP